jgi:outer membrane murein-binding lipoprotein Lpp
MSFDKRVRLTDLGILITLIVLLIKVGDWKGTLEQKQVQNYNAIRTLNSQVSKLSGKVDAAIQQQDDYHDELNSRVSRIEGKITKSLGLPPYGPNNPPPIIKYRPRPGQKDDPIE